MVSLDDKSAILLYRIGPVYCCSPSLAVENISIPGKLTHPPGTDTAHPGIFKHGRYIVSVSDLRFQFGVSENNWQHPGRMVITQLKDQHVGFWVDEIIDVIQFPESGWGNLPAQFPRGIFSRTLLLKERIYLYAEFKKLQTLQGGGYLQQYISNLEQAQPESISQENIVTRQPVETVKALPDDKLTSSITATPSTNHHNNKSIHQTSVNNKPRVTEKNINIKHELAKTKTTPSPDTRATIPAVTRKLDASNPATKNIQANSMAGHEAVKSAARLSQPVDDTVPKKNEPDATIHVTEKQTRPDRTQTTTHSEPQESSGLLGVGLLIIIIISAGLLAYYLLLAEPEKTKPLAPANIYVPSIEKNYSTQIDEPATRAIIATDQEAIPPVQVTTEPTLNPVKETATRTPYHASIEEDEQGITIILNAPKEPAPEIKPEPDKQPALKTETDLKSSNVTTRTGTEATATRNAEQASANNPGAISTPPAPASNKPAKIEIIHVVVKGDTLWHIARRYVDDPFLYPELARLSNIKNPHRIYPGNRVRIIRYLN